MIVGTLDHSEQYYVLGERIKQALEFLKAHDIREMENGRYAIDGTRLSESDLLDLSAKEEQGIFVLV